jgi:hypothetical protein
MSKTNIAGYAIIASLFIGFSVFYAVISVWWVPLVAYAIVGVTYLGAYLSTKQP